MNKQISILGIGWLGFPLAKALLNENYIIKGSTTSENKLQPLEKEHIQAFQLLLNEEGTSGSIQPFLEGSELLIINIPPGLRRNPEGNFVAKIQNLIRHIKNSDIKHVIFVSSTSVFADLDEIPLISEETIPNATSIAGKQLFEVEQLLQNQKKFDTTVLRFAGLFGPNRHPATMLSGKTNIKNPKAPVNLIHLNDCIGVIKTSIESSSWGQVFNASYPDHPEKAEYYSQVCQQMGLPKPEYEMNTPSKGKIINSDKIQNVLEYEFLKDLYS